MTAPLRLAIVARVPLLVVVGAFVLSLVPSLGLAPSSAATDDVDPTGSWPLRPVPEVVEQFHPPSDPWGPGHRGVDLLGSPGQQVRSALPGRVDFAGMVAGRGVVVVGHGDTRTTYEPVSATVPVGAQLRAGDTVGVLDLAGSHCFPQACLHWGWLRGDIYLDPLALVGVQAVRLLPLWREVPVTPSSVPGRAPVLPRAYADWRPWVTGVAPL